MSAPTNSQTFQLDPGESQSVGWFIEPWDTIITADAVAYMWDAFEVRHSQGTITTGDAETLIADSRIVNGDQLSVLRVIRWNVRNDTDQPQFIQIFYTITGVMTTQPL
jgi:hypothetical protein